MSRRARLLSAHLVGYGGTVIASHPFQGPEEDGSEPLARIIPGLLPFLRHVDPEGDGGEILALDQGPFRILVQPGRWSFLALVMEGHEDEVLQAVARDVLASFEAHHDPPPDGTVPDERVHRKALESLRLLRTACQVF